MPRRFQEWLDGVDAVATTIYVVLIAVIAGVVLGGFFYLVWHWQPSWGLQGEGFYLVVAFLLVMGWALSQVAWVIKRRRRNVWTFADDSELPLPKIDVTPDGIKATWGEDATAEEPAARTKTWSFSFDHGSTRTFKIDAAVLMTARAARAEGRSWSDICRVVNPEWDTLGPVDRALYERALAAAVDAAPNTP